ncbi:MAG TPA: amidase family protein, partial [Rhodoglobus sp.]|nr:amidase family protein [Rhodoglobus sp.]
VADAALVLDAIAAPSPFSVGPPSWDGGAFLNAAVRGEGRFEIGVTTASPWSPAYDLDIEPAADEALQVAIRELTAVGHGLQELDWVPGEEYAPAFRTIWQAGAANLPAETDEELGRLEPLTRWLVERGRALGARDLAAALQQLAVFERRTIAAFAPVDAVLTPALAMTPRPVGWYDREDGERNFEQQVRYTPWTSFANVSGLPAIVLPVHHTADGLPMGVQLIGRPGREDVLLAIGAQLERRLHWQRRHPPQW